MLELDEVIVALSCVSAEMERVEKFVADHHGPEHYLNRPHMWWLEIAGRCKQKLEQAKFDLS